MLPTRAEFVSGNDVKGLFKVSSPDYLCFFSDKSDAALKNAGFILGQLILYISSKNLGCCFLGKTKPNQKPDDFVIALAVGHPSESGKRQAGEVFKRKPLADITEIPNAEELLNPVRLAPSAMNSQPWFFSGSKEEILVSKTSEGLLGKLFLSKLNDLDIGISLAFLKLSAEHLGKSVRFDFTPKKTEKGQFAALAVLK